MHREVRDAIEDALPDVRPNPVAIFAAKKLLPTALAVLTSAINSINAPVM